MSTVDPYAAIVELAERELELADAGRLEELCALEPAWEQLKAALPPRPAGDARPELERAAALQIRTRAALLARRSQMLRELRATARAGRAGEGYARLASGRRSRVDRSA